MRQTIFASLSIAALLLSGCGQAVQTGTKLPKRWDTSKSAPLGGMQQPGYGNQQAQVPGALVGNPQADGLTLLNGLRQAFAQSQGFEAEVRTYSEGYYKNAERTGELRRSTTSAKITWAKPNRLRAEVITATNPLLEGGALATPDGKNITARAKGLLSIFPIKLSAGDAKLTNNRNHKFNDINPNSLVTRLTAPTAVWTVVSQGNIGGSPVMWVSVDGVRRLDAEIQSELVAIEPQTFALRGTQMISKGRRVVDQSLTNFRWNPTITADMFAL